ncbi:MAG TPA: hypothetical protein VF210_15530 [Pseudomonadales bacterium]
MTLERLVVLLCAVLFASACAAPAPTAAEPAGGGAASTAGQDLASAETPAATAEDDPIVCRQITRTGTRVAEKVCMRRSQIEKSQRDAAEMLGEVQRRGAMQSHTKQ